jgi:hypothetical protein
MDSFKEALVWAIGFVLIAAIFIGTVVFSEIYTATLKQECRLAAVQQNYAAVEIQAICDRK